MTMTDADPDALERHAARLDDAMARIAALDPTARAAAQDALDALNALHKDGLVTVVRRLREDDRGRELLYGLVDDPGVRMLLGMHGIIRPDPLTLARQALDQVRPGLQSHGGDVELSHVEDSIAYVRLQGACNGCSMAAVTMRNGVEEALLAAVPGLRAIEVLPNDPTPTLIPLDSLTVRPVDESEELLAAGWTRVASLGDIDSDRLRGVTLRPTDSAPVEAIVVNIGGRLTAYVDACAHQGRTLVDALVDESAGTLTCAGHGMCFDAGEGQCLTLPGAALESLPLRVVGTSIWVRARDD